MKPKQLGWAIENSFNSGFWISNGNQKVEFNVIPIWYDQSNLMNEMFTVNFERDMLWKKYKPSILWMNGVCLQAIDWLGSLLFLLLLFQIQLWFGYVFDFGMVRLHA